MTPEEWEIVYAFQQGVCYVCGEPQPPTKKGAKRLATDHDHDTGEVRGLLCSRCNPVLGKLENAFKRYGLSKVQGLTLLRVIFRLHEYLESPPARRALGKTVIGYPGRVGTIAHRKWVRQTSGKPPDVKKRKKLR